MFLTNIKLNNPLLGSSPDTNKWLEDKRIGEPVATCKANKDELLAAGIVGVYTDG